MQTIYYAMVSLLLGLSSVWSQMEENEEICFPFRRTSIVRSPAVNQQGHPGKTGAPGPTGWFSKQK